jgi:hypothetical protein
MPIHVVCPGCRKAFNVSDKFAGQTGACPKCKGKITVPAKDEEVKVHGGQQFVSGGRSVTGQLLLKPISRRITRWDAKKALIVGGAVVGTLLATLIGRWTNLLGDGGPLHGFLFCGLGLLVISPPLSFAAYTFLRDDEMEPFPTKELYIRCASCAGAYVVLWGAFAYVAGQGLLSGEAITWLVAAPPFFVLGTLAANVALELEYGNAFFHYSFYLLVTMALRWVAGLKWVWDQAGMQ